MKKILAIFILTFMIGSMLVGCAREKPNDEKKQAVVGGLEKENDKVNNTEEQTNTESSSNETLDQNPEHNIYEGSENNNDVGSENNTNEGSENNTNEGSETNSEPKPVLTVGTQIGDLMQSVTLERVNGGTVSIDDYKGKIIIFNLWATWCPPCKAELPDFDKIASEYDGEVVIIAAHVPYGNNTAYSYVSTNFPDSKIIFALDTPNSDAYIAAGGDGYVPYTAILDQRGVIIYSDSGALSHDQLVSIIEKNR